MCTATETIDLALAAERVDIAAAFADGTPLDPQADRKLDWTRALAFTGAHVEPNPQIASFSDIDGHQVNAGPRRQPLGAFKLFNFSAKIDPVPTMLVQSHRQVIPDFYGLTTSFVRDRLKPSDLVLADEEARPGSSTSTATTARERGRSSAGTIPKTSSTRSATRRPTCRSTRIRRATG